MYSGAPDPAPFKIYRRMFKLLMHEPDYADTTAAYSFHLQLSGHSHGGQIRLPWIGEVITPPGAKRYVQGLYTTGSQGIALCKQGNRHDASFSFLVQT